jgi:hypothetical protein
MLLHVIDATNPNAVVAAQHDPYRRIQRRVFPSALQFIVALDLLQCSSLSC